MDVTQYTRKYLILSSWTKNQLPVVQTELGSQKYLDLWQPLRKSLNNITINDAKFAHHLCNLIPSQCPFARRIEIFGYTLVNIPPLCKINPLYEELMALRFRAICYLADECGEDISAYC